jgi:hypothetical protein
MNWRLFLVSILSSTFLVSLTSNTSSADSVNVKLILVKTNSWQEKCNGGFYSATIDLSLAPVQNCGLRILVDKKVQGTKHFQVYDEARWQDLERHNHWIMTSKPNQNTEGKSVYSESVTGRKITRKNFGYVVNSSKYKSDEEYQADWGSAPLPFSGNIVEGGDVYDSSISSLKIRARVMVQGKNYFSNAISLEYKNHAFYVYEIEDMVAKFTPRNEYSPKSTVQGSSVSGSSSTLGGSAGSKEISCNSLASVYGGNKFFQTSVYLDSNNQRSYKIQNLTSCSFEVEITAVFRCGLRAENLGSKITLTVYSKEQILLPNNLYFPQAVAQCRNLSGTRNVLLNAIGAEGFLIILRRSW